MGLSDYVAHIAAIETEIAVRAEIDSDLNSHHSIEPVIGANRIECNAVIWNRPTPGKHLDWEYLLESIISRHNRDLPSELKFHSEWGLCRHADEMT